MALKNLILLSITNLLKKNKPKNLQIFVKDILRGKINSKCDAAEEYLKNISDDQNLFEKITRNKQGSRRQKIKSYMSTAEFIIFGPDGPSKSDTNSESEKLDIAEAGRSEDEQQGQGLKIMTPKQMITRLPILLAQLKAGNNSQKLKNEIREIAYSLYRSKNLYRSTKLSIII